MATGRDRKTQIKLPAEKVSGFEPLSRDDLYSILRRQIRGRNEKCTQSEFHRILAEEVITAKIGSFYYGEHLLNRAEDPQLRAKADQFDLIAHPKLPYRLTEGPVETTENPCACTDLTGLTIQGVHLSGSKLEGSDVRLNGNPWEWSDIDVMLQLGPVTVLDQAGVAPSAGAARQSAGVSVTSESTTQKGFFLLHHERVPSCRHCDLQLFSGYRLKKKLLNIVKMKALEEGNTFDWTFEGPALTNTDLTTSADIVTCISYPPWPRTEFAARARPARHPSAALVSRLCRTPALLVPVGSAGSATKQHEWRLSFSRHEFLAHRAMPQALRDCLVVLKHVNTVVNGPHGAMKGFQLKTAVLWLAERHGEEELEQWGIHECLLIVLRFVEQSAVSGRLDCYFWTEINLLSGRTAEDLAKLRAAVDRLREHMATAVRVLVAIFVHYDDSGVRDACLPSRKYRDLWKFMFPGVNKQFQQKPGDGYVKLASNYPLPDTWMSWENIGKLFSNRAPAKPLYDRVLKKLESPAETECERAARERKSRGVQWTEDY